MPNKHIRIYHLNRIVFSNIVVTSHIWLFKIENSVPQSQQLLVAGGYYTRQHRHRTFPLLQEDLWDSTELEYYL